MARDSGASPPEGKALSRYTFGRELGRGGMGIVYEALDARLGRKVAVKILQKGQYSEEGRRRFLQEAQAASALNHPGIVTVHDIESAGDHDFMVMEYVDGSPLSHLVEAGALPLGQAFDYAEQIAGALAAAHAAGIVHRDVKPANVMVTRDGRVKVLDFGLSKQLRPPDPVDASGTTRMSTPLTIQGVVMGSSGYMSPEQASGDVVDARTDVFSFGILLYEMLTGTRPFSGESSLSTMRAVLQDRPKPIGEFRSDVAPEAQDLVARCLEKEPAKRYASAIEIHAELARFARPVPLASSHSSVSRRHVRVAVSAAAAIVAVAAFALWTFVRRAENERERQAAIAEVEDLLNQGRLVDVWRAAADARRRWPDEPQLQQALGASTNLVTIATEPPGAQVAFKAYDDVDGEWMPLGISPLAGVRAPLGQLRWRITKEGYEPLVARLEVGAPAAAVGRPDVDAPRIVLRRIGGEPARMVFVPGGDTGGVKLTDYWIDQFEVTNREFKTFVDRGGYQDPQQWIHLGQEAPRHSRDGADRALRDRTGRPGPSTWELGSYAEGRGDHPVSGVSWFEAAAYCQSAGKTLPTVFHWQKAFGATFFMEVVTLGNFASRGPEATGQLKEVGPYGTYGMAGNVKEWVWNASKGQRYILGGAWNEPVYMATASDMRPPLDRAETHGFRCIKEMRRSAPVAYAEYSDESRARDFTKEKPADAAAFGMIRRFYTYDRTPLESKVQHTEQAEHWRRERVSFAAAYGGERVLANILIPKNAAPPYQAVIWFPGSYALGLKSTDGDLPFSMYFDFVARGGRALVYPVYKGTYERPAPLGPGPSQERDVVVQWVKDFSRTLDYLESRGDFDRDKLAYYGYSMGADHALPILALEPRLKTAVLLAGGMNSVVRAPEIEPLNLLPRVRMPVLLLGGRFDFIFPVETSQAPLFKLLGTPAEHKKHVIFEGAGHVPPRIEVIREILDWLDRYLGRVAQRPDAAR